MRNWIGCHFFFFLLVLLAVAGTGHGEVYQVNRRSQWQEWQFPAGILDLGANGWITPMKFDAIVNAALDAGKFSHPIYGGGEARGGVRSAGSNLAAGRNIIDGNPDTFWKPDPDASLEDWWIEIDLGRAVPVTQIRLLFVDQEGTRPFREFRVFGADGRKVLLTGEDIFSFNLIGGTTRYNTETVIEYNVRPLVSDQTLILGDSPGSVETDLLELLSN